MRKPKDMTEDELREIAALAQRFLYHEHDDVWNIDKDVPCGDFTMEMGALLDSLGMAPDGAEELERKAKREEFAQFVDKLVNDGTPIIADVVRLPLAEIEQRYGRIAEPTDGLVATFVPPGPLAGEEIRRGDLIAIIDGKIRLHDRAEAVKRLLAEYDLWSGGFKPAETSHEERNTFLAGRDLDEAQESAMWPERHGLAYKRCPTRTDSGSHKFVLCAHGYAPKCCECGELESAEMHATERQAVRT